MASSDYYKLLGVPRTATTAEIKKAFRRLARRHHPDVNPGNAESAEQFRLISEAFEVLSDPKKRAVYDRVGHYSERAEAKAKVPGFDFSAFGAGNFKEAFAEIFANLKRDAAAARQPQRGLDIEVPLALSFEEAMTGRAAGIEVERNEACPECQGQGQIGEAGPPAQPCAACRGTGLVGRRESLTVRIPAGVDTGSRVRLPGKGHAGRFGGPPGDLYVVTNVGSHPIFTRQGDNLYCTVPITVPEAALGARIEVPTIDGKASLRIPPGTQSGQKFRLRERGAPSLRAGGARGDQFVEVKITLPRVIGEETKELLHRYARHNPENPRTEMGLE